MCKQNVRIIHYEESNYFTLKIITAKLFLRTQEINNTFSIIPPTLHTFLTLLLGIQCVGDKLKNIKCVVL